MDGESSDVVLSLVILCGLFAAGSIVTTYAAPTQSLSAIGFAAAIGFGSLLILAQHWRAAQGESNSH